MELPHVWKRPFPGQNVVGITCSLQSAKHTTLFLSSWRFKAGVTLRFPRLEAIRTDKMWYECLNLTELAKLKSVSLLRYFSTMKMILNSFTLYVFFLEPQLWKHTKMGSFLHFSCTVLLPFDPVITLMPVSLTTLF